MKFIMLIILDSLLRQAEFDERNTTRCVSQDKSRTPNMLFDNYKEAKEGFPSRELPNAVSQIFYREIALLDYLFMP
jgi:hypothetical protein